MKGFYHITEKIRDIANANTQISVVTEGDIFEVDLNKQGIFPLLHIITDSAEIGQKTTTMNFTLLCMDLVDVSNNDPRAQLDSFFKTSNEQDVLNSTLNFLNNIITEFKRGDAYDDLFHLVGDANCTPFRQRFENLLAGWSCDFSVLVPNPSPIC